jgi:replicative DNA helicase
MNDILENGVTDSHDLVTYEKTILAIALSSKNAVVDIVTKLEAIDFSIRPHVLLFEAIINLVQEQTKLPISVATLTEKLKEFGTLEEVGGVGYINEVLVYYFNDLMVDQYIDIIFANSLSRRLTRALNEINLLKANSSNNVQDLVLKAQEKILSIKTDIDLNDAEELKEIVERVVKNTLALKDNDVELTGVTTGFNEIDNLTSGLQKGDFVILAARPSMGKTALALNLAINAAMAGKSVGIFSLEMPKEQLAQRILSSSSLIDSKKIRTGQGITPDEQTRLVSMTDILGEYKITIDDTPGLDILQLQSKIRKMKRDSDIEICFIDYLQLLSGTPNKNETRQNEVSTISRYIKKIAREIGIPIVCLSQLSRSVESREDKKPLMSDLRDSGAIEQDADIIMFLYREEYYSKKIEDANKAELIFSKHRNGSTGIVKLNFDGEYGRFSDENHMD